MFYLVVILILIRRAGGRTKVIMLISPARGGSARQLCTIGSNGGQVCKREKFAAHTLMLAARLIKSNLTLMNHLCDNAPYSQNFVGRLRLLTAK